MKARLRLEEMALRVNHSFKLIDTVPKDYNFALFGWILGLLKRQLLEVSQVVVAGLTEHLCHQFFAVNLELLLERISVG